LCCSAYLKHIRIRPCVRHASKSQPSGQMAPVSVSLDTAITLRCAH
jgi:hypothetical protein